MSNYKYVHKSSFTVNNYCRYNKYLSVCNRRNHRRHNWLLITGLRFLLLAVMDTKQFSYLYASTCCIYDDVNIGTGTDWVYSIILINAYFTVFKICVESLYQKMKYF